MALGLSIFGFALAVLCVYVLSYGLWLRYYAWGSDGNATVDAAGFYRPLMLVANKGPRLIAEPYNRYLMWVINVGVI